ncbi:hypothetical protein BU16DRAFT_620675 [Lophium mytilinum]|uniref:DUF7580 domain-containing protein n=1 Tax=Lophium mytilinum TaxID=390894 RepID=A0A6A6QK05_9PEZI|nr:hypothetical protein BU16DRAFT_620675 [Lophium mytilinum]
MSGAEVGGLVLGGISLAIAAVEHYNNLSQTAHGLKNYHCTLQQLKLNLIIQQDQLKQSLKQLGFDDFSIPSTRHALQDRIYCGRPDLEHPEMVAKCDDTQRKSKPAKAWNRFKHTFTAKFRKGLMEDLQHSNSMLAHYVKRSKIARHTFDIVPVIQEARSQHSSSKCDAMRVHALAVFDSFKSCWKCSCVDPHQTGIRFDSSPSTSHAPVLEVAFRTFDTPHGQDPLPQHDDETPCWIETVAKFETVARPDLRPDLDTSSASSASASQQFSQRKLGKMPEKQYAQFTSQMLQQKKKSVSGQTSAQLNVLTSKPGAMASITKPTAPEVECLCAALRRQDFQEGGLSRVKASSKRRIMITVTNTESKPHLTRYQTLDSFIGLSGRFDLISRVQRLDIAYAMATMLLHLGETPWLNPKWGKEHIGLALGKQDATPNIIPQDVRVLHEFQSQASPVSPSRNLMENSGRINSLGNPNPAMLSLGILLIELCLNEDQSALLSAAFSGSFSPDTRERKICEIIERVYLEGGNFYGAATERCLRCQFTGPAATKTFLDRSFQENFFKDVIALLQVTYEVSRDTTRLSGTRSPSLQNST